MSKVFYRNETNRIMVAESAVVAGVTSTIAREVTCSVSAQFIDPQWQATATIEFWGAVGPLFVSLDSTATNQEIENYIFEQGLI